MFGARSQFPAPSVGTWNQCCRGVNSRRKSARLPTQSLCLGERGMIKTSSAPLVLYAIKTPGELQRCKRQSFQWGIPVPRQRVLQYLASNDYEPWHTMLFPADIAPTCYKTRPPATVCANRPRTAKSNKSDRRRKPQETQEKQEHNRDAYSSPAPAENGDAAAMSSRDGRVSDDGGDDDDGGGGGGGTSGEDDDDNEFSEWRVHPRLTPRKDSALQVKVWKGLNCTRYKRSQT